MKKLFLSIAIIIAIATPTATAIATAIENNRDFSQVIPYNDNDEKIDFNCVVITDADGNFIE